MQSIHTYRHLLLTSIVFFVGAFLYKSANSGNANPSPLYLLALSVVAVCFGLLYINFTLAHMKILGLVVGIAILVVILVSCLDTLLFGPAIFSAVGSVLGLGATIISLAIVYKILKPHLEKWGGFSRIFVLVVFYVPRLLTSVIEFLLKEYRNTSYEIFALLLLEIIVVLAYCLVNWSREDKKKTKIVSDVMFLDKKKIVKISSNLLRGQEADKDKNLGLYSISLWTSINTDATSRFSAPIVHYGDAQQGKPTIAYEFDDSTQQNAFSFRFGNYGSATMIYLPPQQWHHIAIVYDGSSASLFCNGLLARKVDLKNHLPTYSSADYIQVGSDRILNGAVTGVNFYSYELSALAIMGMYQMGI